MQQTIRILGASNVDITGFTKDKLIYADANIGYTKTSAGGVGRNIAENLKLLGFTIELISVFGDDPLSKFLINSCKEKDLHIDTSLFLTNKNTATFLAVMDENNDLAVGISAMDIYNYIDINSIITAFKTGMPTDYTVLETNFPQRILESIIPYTGPSKLVLDTVSGKKALRAKNILNDLYLLKTNLLEAKMLVSSFGENFTDDFSLARFFIEKGVTNVFITLGEKGVIYADKTGVYSHKSIPAPVVNTIGAGDSFVAGIVYADSLGLDIHKKALYGMASAHINVQYDEAVSPELNSKSITTIVSNQK